MVEQKPRYAKLDSHFKKVKLNCNVIIATYLCNQLGNVLFSCDFAGSRCARPANIPLVTQNCISQRITYKIFSNFDKKKFLQTLNEVMNISLRINYYCVKISSR
jgi:hypothetical protein